MKWPNGLILNYHAACFCPIGRTLVLKSVLTEEMFTAESNFNMIILNFVYIIVKG